LANHIHASPHNYPKDRIPLTSYLKVIYCTEIGFAKAIASL
jgi:hypothetical protein